MFLRAFAAMFAVIGLVGLMFFSTGCSIVSYSNLEPENPYGEPPVINENIAVGFLLK